MDPRFREDDDEFLWLPNHTGRNVPDSSVRRQESILILLFCQSRDEGQNGLTSLRLLKIASAFAGMTRVFVAGGGELVFLLRTRRCFGDDGG